MDTRRRETAGRKRVMLRTNFAGHQVGKNGIVVLALMGLLVGMVCGLMAQTTVATGSVQGIVTDPSGASVSGAKVTITNTVTGQVIETKTTSAGTYTSGALQPGTYKVRVEQNGFKSEELILPVGLGVATAGSMKLQVGQASEVVQVQGESIKVDTEQATVQGVITAQQIDSLPVNGRNFLDLAQLEPGVQIQDGGNFDPTKNGFSSISFGGRFGRTARIEVDGIDISDETVGTTTQNIPMGAIQESQYSQSMLDLSTELTSSGSVNVVTRTGTNQWHGQGFYFFRNQALGANLPGGSDNPFQRNQFGGRVGGPIIKDKLFVFVDAERTKQNLLSPVVPSPPFESLIGSFDSPFRETETIGRLDWQIKPNNYKLFYRFSYDQSSNTTGYVPNSFQPFASDNHTPVQAAGLDFVTGAYTHAIRFGYTKFRNNIVDAVSGTNIFNPAPQLELAIGSDANCLTAGADAFCSGPNFLAPQATYQSDHQIKYDGSRPFGAHIFRYGVSYNHIHGGGYAKFLGLAPAVGAPISACDATCLAMSGGAANPLNYPAVTVTLGNGQGFSSEQPAFGSPAGGLGPDNRFAWYFGDSWKIKKNLTMTYGVRYVRDTGRTDSDIPPIPCSQLDPTLAANLAAGGTPCTGNILDLFGTGLGNRVRQPNTNFAPQLGLAWDPNNSGKTVIRGGIGLFYENSVWNNILFDRPGRLQTGLFLAQQSVCSNGAPVSFTLPGTGTVVNPTFCNQPIGAVQSDIAALQSEYQAATLSAGPAVNSVFIGNILASGTNATGTNLLAPNYVTPRSVQMNLGMQHEFGKGIVASVDFLRNVGTHSLLSIDTNHVGDARYLDTAAALAAINTTVTAVGCPAASSAGSQSQAAVACYLATVSGPSIADFAVNGLDSGNSVCGGLPCPLAGAPAAAFPGVNKNLGTNQMLFPIGRSVYDGLQASLRGNINHLGRGLRSLDLQVAYSFSKFTSTARDSDYINFAQDNVNPTKYIGPNALDRTHQISFGGTMALPKAFRVSFLGHFYSPLPVNPGLTLPVSGNAGGIFQTDVTGDGTGDGTSVSNGGFGDLLPGTNIGSFGRDFGVNGMNRLIANYNLNFAGQRTPAGQALFNAGLFSSSQLVTLGAVMQPVQIAPPGQVNMGWLRSLDMAVSWVYQYRERVTFEPKISFFNVFNFSNFDGPNNPLSGVLDATSGSVNGTANRQPDGNRVGLGSGVFGLGAPRVIEVGVTVSF
jgi:hypothetical protein